MKKIPRVSARHQRGTNATNEHTGVQNGANRVPNPPRSLPNAALLGATACFAPCTPSRPQTGSRGRRSPRTNEAATASRTITPHGVEARRATPAVETDRRGRPVLAWRGRTRNSTACRLPLAAPVALLGVRPEPDEHELVVPHHGKRGGHAPALSPALTAAAERHGQCVGRIGVRRRGPPKLAGAATARGRSGIGRDHGFRSNACVFEPAVTSTSSVDSAL